MDKDENIDEALEKMREENAAAGAATPPPDWGKLEQSVILRLVRQVKARRVVIGVLSAVIIGAVMLWLAWKLFVPELDYDKTPAPSPQRWQVGGINVMVLPPLESQRSTSNLKYSLYFKKSYFTDSFSVQLVELPKPIMGSRFYGMAVYDDYGCIFLPLESLPMNTLQGSSAQYFLYEQAMAQGVDAYAEKMLAAKIWPVRLWKLYPATKLLYERKYQVIEAGPVNGTLRSTKLYYGKYYVYDFRATSRNSAAKITILEASIWPTKYALSAMSSKLVADGDGKGYRIYEDANYWGTNTKEYLNNMRFTLDFAKRSASLGQNEPGSDLISRLTRIQDLIDAKIPEYSTITNKTALRKITKPWYYWEGWDEAVDRKKHELYKTKNGTAVAQGNVGTVSFSKPEKGTFQISRGGIALVFRSTFSGLGPRVEIRANGKLALEYEVRSETPYPVLQTKFDWNTEKLLSDSAAIAREVLSKPSSTWPETTIPMPYLVNWMNDIAARRIVLRRENQEILVRSYLRWEGDKTELLLSLGPREESALELAVRPEGFSVFSRSSEYILNNKAGAVEIVQAEGNKNPVLTAAELRQLKGCLGLLADIPELKAELSPASAGDQLKFKLKDGIPENLMPGIEMLAAFLEKPELPEAKKVAQPPKLEWDMDTYEEITKAIQ